MSVSDISATGLLEEFPEAGLIMRTDGTLAYLNPAALRLFELEGETSGRNITEFLPENERARLDPLTWMARWAERPDAPELTHVYLNCRTTRGREIPVRVRVGRVRDGDVVYYAVTLQDISEQLERQHQSRQSHRLAARVLAISADAIVTVDESLVIAYANPSAEKLFGYRSGELIGRPLNDLLPPEHRARHAEQISAFARETAPARLMGERNEIAGLTREGEVIPLEASITKVTIDQAVMFSAHLRDLRARKAHEQQLTQTAAQLETVFDHAVQAMALIAPDGRVLRMNRAARQLLPAEVNPIGAAFAMLPFWSADPEATARALTEALAACGRGERVRMPAAVTLPDGETRQLDFSLSPVTDATGTFAMIAEARALLDTEA